MSSAADERRSPVTAREPFGLPLESIQRIAKNSGVDANAVRRVLRTYERCEERRRRDAKLVEDAVGRAEQMLRLRHELLEDHDAVV
jgi:hypothetical protein